MYIEGRAEKDPSEFWYEVRDWILRFLHHSSARSSEMWCIWCLELRMRTMPRRIAVAEGAGNGRRNGTSLKGQHDAQRPAFKRSGLGLD
jgi:hypothetical protein